MSEFTDLNNSVNNNALYDPLQGYDADVWALDEATGIWQLVGRFTSMEMVFRNTTRPYIEFNQRVMRQLDGTFMMGFTMERGQLDARVLQQTFGYERISRTIRVNRHPRMRIVFQVNAQELEEADSSNGVANQEGTFSTSDTGTSNDIWSGVANTTTSGGGSKGIVGEQEKWTKRNTTGLVALENAKIETFTIRAEAGDEIITNRWEGVAEGYHSIDSTSVWAGHYLTGNGANEVAGVDAREALEDATL
jgi:hypothetical protein